MVKLIKSHFYFQSLQEMQESLMEKIDDKSLWDPQKRLPEHKEYAIFYLELL